MQNTVIRGIPISQLLKQMAGPGEGQERHKFYPIEIPRVNGPEEDAGDIDREYFKTVERDFAGTAGDILERLNLSHMRKK